MWGALCLCCLRQRRMPGTYYTAWKLVSVAFQDIDKIFTRIATVKKQWEFRFLHQGELFLKVPATESQVWFSAMPKKKKKKKLHSYRKPRGVLVSCETWGESWLHQYWDKTELNWKQRLTSTGLLLDKNGACRSLKRSKRQLQQISCVWQPYQSRAELQASLTKAEFSNSNNFVFVFFCQCD